MAQMASQALLRTLTEFFWAQGYHQSSVPELAAALTISPSKFYRLFHSKQAAFLQCLTVYNQLLANNLKAAQASAASLGEPPVVQVVALLLAPSPNEAFPKGCLLVNTIAEFGDTDPLVAAQTQLISATVRNQFVKTLGTFHGLQSVGDLATTLVSLRNGYQLASKQGISYQQLKRQATSSVQELL